MQLCIIKFFCIVVGYSGLPSRNQQEGSPSIAEIANTPVISGDLEQYLASFTLNKVTSETAMEIPTN